MYIVFAWFNDYLNIQANPDFAKKKKQLDPVSNGLHKISQNHVLSIIYPKKVSIFSWIDLYKSYKLSDCGKSGIYLVSNNNSQVKKKFRLATCKRWIFETITPIT